MSRLIKSSTVSHSVVDFLLKPLLATMDVSKIIDEKSISESQG